MTDLPPDLQYAPTHEWLRVTDGPQGRTARVGISDHAQEQLGDVVMVTQPEAGDVLVAGEPFGEIDSPKSSSVLYAPVSGTVTAVNTELETAPDLVNADPYGDGWLIEVEVADGPLPELLDADGYRASLTG